MAVRTHELQEEVSRRALAQKHVTRLMQKLVTSQEENGPGSPATCTISSGSS